MTDDRDREARSAQTEITPARAEAAFGVTPPEAAGALVAGRYEILALIGRGGMGAVYRARDRELDLVVAIKFLDKQLASDPALRERFRREVVLARKVTHKNIARTYDIGEHEGGRFLTMEHVDGESLQSVIARSGPLPDAEVLRIAVAICDGLEAAHEQGVVHRDLKPDNVLIERGGRVVITDFGVARAAGGTDGALLTAGQMVGTPAYMAPEQLEGASDIDARADLYALGVMLYQMLTGDLPWKAQSAFAMIRARIADPTPTLIGRCLDNCPFVAGIVAKLMALEPKDRFTSAADLRAALFALEKCEIVDDPSLRGTAPTRIITSRPPAPTGPRTLLILPLANRGEAADAYLARGLTEELTDVLSMTDGLRVRAPRVVDGAADPAELGRAAGVDVVIEGSFRRHEGALRLAARLVSTNDGFQLWAKRFEAPAGDPFTIMEDVARAISAALTVDRPAPVAPAPLGVDTADLYLRARAALFRCWYTDAGDAIGLFEQALVRAPTDVRILSGAASAHARQIFFAGARGPEHATRARSLARAAIAADPRRGEPFHALALVALYSGDPAGALRSARAALDRAGDLPEAHEMVGRILAEIGPVHEARAHLARALTLDPELPQPVIDLARLDALDGAWPAVVAALAGHGTSAGERALARALLARLALWCRVPPSVAIPGDDVPLGAGPEAIEAWTALFRTVRATGKVDVAVRASMTARIDQAPLEGRLRPLLLQQLCEAHAYAGERDPALDALERAVAAGMFDRTWLERCPLLDPLRSNPRFAAATADVARRLDGI